MSDELNQVYWERNQLVAALSKIWPSCIELDANQPPEWRCVVYVESPAGQLSWHVHQSEIEKYFGHLSYAQDPQWDGHTTEEKYERLRSLPIASEVA